MLVKSILKATVFSIFLLFNTYSSLAQEQDLPLRSVTQPATTGSWNGLYNTWKIGDRLFYYAETHYRRRNSLDNRSDFVGRMGQIYNRHGLKYIFNQHFNVTAGPTFVLNYTPQPGNDDYDQVTMEPRFWHQWIFVMPPMGRSIVYHQFRFEHRFKRDNLKGADYFYTDRYRYKLFAYIPINKPVLEEKTFFFSPSAEIFFESGKNVVYNHYEDFRIYTAIGYIFNSRYMFFGGHMWTIGQNSDGFSYNQSHIIRLNLFITLDLTKKPSKGTLPFILN